MTKRGARRIDKSGAGRALEPPAPVRTREQEARLNRLLIVAGAALSLGAIVLALLSHPFDLSKLAINLAVIAAGLLMGKAVGRFMFRGVAPSATK